MRRIVFPIVSALALLLSACGDDKPTVNKVAVEKTVKELEGKMLKAATTKDAATFAANYATDAVFMSTGEPPAKGQSAIRTTMASLFADPNFKLDFASDRVEISDSGDLAATRGSYTMNVTDPFTKKLVADKGSYITVFRKQTDGAWKATLDIISSEIPPPPPPAPKSAAKSSKKKSKKR